MPLHESHTLDTTAPVEKKPDFAALQAEKERIFKEIEEKSLTLDLGETINIIGLVSDSSVKDAFELARRLSLPGDAALFALTQFAPVAKHEKFFSQFANVLRDNRSYVNNYLFIDNTLDRIQNPKHEYLIAENRRGLRGGSPPDLVAEIESHYAHYIRNRSLLPPELPEDQRTMAEATAEDHLLSAEAILNESYYTGPVREMLGIDTEDTLEDLSQFPGNRSMKHLDEKYLWALRGNVIDRETLFLLLQELGEVSTNAEMEKILTGPLKKARYAPSKLVFETRKKESEKALVKDIQESLKKRGYKEDDFEVRFNEEKGEYEVVEKGGKGGQESEENTVPVKENFRNYADLHREVACS